MAAAKSPAPNPAFAIKHLSDLSSIDRMRIRARYSAFASYLARDADGNITDKIRDDASESDLLEVQAGIAEFLRDSFAVDVDAWKAADHGEAAAEAQQVLEDLMAELGEGIASTH